METEQSEQKLHVFQEIVSKLTLLSAEDQRRTISAVITLLGLDIRIGKSERNHDVFININEKNDSPGFVDREQVSPKEFLLEKEPKTDIERAACLAYYLTHYRDTPHFKTVDISTLNIEAAQPKFANAAQTVKNSIKAGLIVPSIKGKRQLSAFGEQFVQKMPDREAMKEVTNRLKRKKPRPSKVKISQTSNNDNG